MSTSCHMLAGSNMNMKGNYDSETVTIGARSGGDFWDDEE